MIKKIVLGFSILILTQCTMPRYIEIDPIEPKGDEQQIKSSLFIPSFKDKRSVGKKNQIGLYRYGRNRKAAFTQNLDSTISAKVAEGLGAKSFKIISKKEKADFVLEGEIQDFFITWSESKIGIAKEFSWALRKLKINYQLKNAQNDSTVWEKSIQSYYSDDEIKKEGTWGTGGSYMTNIASKNIERNVELLLKEAEFINKMQ